MWPKFFKSKFFDVLAGLAITILTVLLTQSLIAGRDYKKKVRDDIDSKASIQQVQTQKQDIINYVDQQDKNVDEKLEQHMQESRETDAREMELIKSMDRKIDILLNRTNK